MSTYTCITSAIEHPLINKMCTDDTSPHHMTALSHDTEPSSYAPGRHKGVPFVRNEDPESVQAVSLLSVAILRVPIL